MRHRCDERCARLVASAMIEAVPGQVVLRQVDDEDLPVLFEHQIDPDATRMAAFPARDRDAFMAHWERITRDPRVEARTVVLDGRVAGNVMSFEHDGRREVGYWIGREFWGSGVATRALSAFLEEETRRPLHAGVATHNAGSIRVLEKCGFALAGEDGGGDGGLLFVLGAQPVELPSPHHP